MTAPGTDAPSGARRVAVVVPTFNEADRIAALIAHLQAAGADEIVVSDGESADGTAAIAAAAGAQVVSGPAGRGGQITAGAAATTADSLVILHADTRLPAGAIDVVRAALADPAVGGGAFRLAFDARGFWLDLFAWCSRLESAWTTFGDQAMFCRRSDFFAVGGAPPWPILEDVELRRRLRTRGRFMKAPLAATTSARRFQRVGVITQQLRNGLILFAFFLGVSPRRLARFYRPEATGDRARRAADRRHGG